MYYGMTPPPADLPLRAVMEDYSPDGVLVTEEACRDALSACFAKGWLRIIDAPALAKIIDDLAADGILGPIYGLPFVGGVDFTVAGAELEHKLIDEFKSANDELRDRLFPQARSFNPTPTPFAFTDVVRNKSHRYFTSKEAALAGIEDVRKQNNCVSIAGPFPIGPWRLQWWRRFGVGCRIEIDEERQWQGKGSGGGEMFFLDTTGLKLDPQRLMQILSRHELTPADWLLFTAMERDWCARSVTDLPQWLSKGAVEECGMPISEDECRIGLENCLHRGWLRVVDENVIREICDLLRNEPTLLPLPSATECQLGCVDFTQRGADFYRMVAADFLGPDWEAGLYSCKEYYWEEHHYSESEADLRAIAKQPRDSGKVIASEIIPIGPWCVLWWDCFPAGFRLELKIEDR